MYNTLTNTDILQTKYKNIVLNLVPFINQFFIPSVLVCEHMKIHQKNKRKKTQYYYVISMFDAWDNLAKRTHDLIFFLLFELN